MHEYLQNTAGHHYEYRYQYRILVLVCQHYEYQYKTPACRHYEYQYRTQGCLNYEYQQKIPAFSYCEYHYRTPSYRHYEYQNRTPSYWLITKNTIAKPQHNILFKHTVPLKLQIWGWYLVFGRQKKCPVFTTFLPTVKSGPWAACKNVYCLISLLQMCPKGPSLYIYRYICLYSIQYCKNVYEIFNNRHIKM